MQSLVGGVLAIVGMMSRKRYDLDIAEFYIKLLLIGSLLLGSLQGLNGLFSYFYLNQVFNKKTI